YHWADSVKIDEAPFNVRERLQWIRALLFMALFVVPIGVHAWPWQFLPLRWQYPGAIRRGERMVDTIERFKAANGRLPNPQELGNALPLDDWPCSECSDPRGTSYRLMVAGGFDYTITYDPQTRAFRRDP